MKRILAISTLSMGLATASIAQSHNVAGLRTGKLANGLTYYIYPTEYTPGKVHLYLVQNIGSVLEKDKEQGIAHFLEHIAFNPTRHFPKGVMSYLLNSGLKEFDAKTGINETRYQINNIPTEDKGKVDSTLLILKDWVDGIRITPEAVEKERAIVLEEWRQRAGIDRRLSDAIAPTIYNGSPYSYRNTIGSEKGLRSHTVKDLKTFYDAWYHPSLQTVMIIGDIKPEEYEARLNKLFDTPNKRKAPERKDIVIPEQQKPLYFRFIDRENPNNSFGISQRISVPPRDRQRNHVAENLYEKIFNNVIAQRIARLRNENKEEFISMSASYSSLVRGYDLISWDVVPYPGKGEQALKQAIAIREQLRREGITEQEFETELNQMLSDVKDLLEQKDLSAPDNLMELFKQNFLYDAPLKTMRQEVTATYEELTEIERSDVNEWIQRILSDDNLSFITYTNDEKELNIPLSTFTQLLAESKQAPVFKFSEPKAITQLIKQPIKAGSIKQESLIKELNAKEWRLSNGAKMLYKYVPELSGTFYFVASQKGGRSVVAPRDIPAYMAMQSLIMRSGVGGYNRNELHHFLQDKNIELNISLDNYSNGYGGNTSTSQAKTFFEYLYLVLTQQNFSASSLEKYKALQKYIYTSRMQTPRGQVDESIKQLLYPISEINPEQNEAFFDGIKYDDVLRLYNEHLLSTQDYTFCLIGDIPEVEAKHLASQYIASLPSTQALSKVSRQELDFTAKASNITKEFTADLEGDIGEAELSFSHDYKLTDREEKAMPVLETLLQNILFEELREKEQGVYSIGVNLSYEEQPTPSTSLSIRFNTERTKVDRMKQKTYDILKSVSSAQISELAFKQALVPHALQAEATALTPEDNPLIWLVYLNAYEETGKLPDLKQSINSVKTEELTMTDLVQLAKKLTTGGKQRDIVLKSLPRDVNHLHHR